MSNPSPRMRAFCEEKGINYENLKAAMTRNQFAEAQLRIGRDANGNRAYELYGKVDPTIDPNSYTPPSSGPTTVDGVDPYEG